MNTNNQDIKMKVLWHWHNRVKTHKPICVDIQIFQLLKEEID
jgi:hypothetical protein